jgi:hypothetical protein
MKESCQVHGPAGLPLLKQTRHPLGRRTDEHKADLDVVKKRKKKKSHITGNQTELGICVTYYSYLEKVH